MSFKWHGERVDQAKVSDACQTIAVEFAKGTDTPLDDLAAAQTGKVIAVVLKRLLVPSIEAGPLLETVRDPEDIANKETQIRSLAQAKGVSLSPSVLKLLLQFAIPVIEKILNGL